VDRVVVDDSQPARSVPLDRHFLAEPQPNAAPGRNLARQGLDRDRAVDETGGQIAVFGRLGSRPFNLEEMQRLYLNPDGTVWTVRNTLPAAGVRP
jgi:hypothetical protein